MPGEPKFSLQLEYMGLEIIDDPFIRDRESMVREQIEARGIGDERVLEALRRVPRHRFLPRELWRQAYEDHPLPIGPEQTISQPYIVASMAEILSLNGPERVLEIGSGCGYAAAVLSLLAKDVYGIELHGALALQSCKILEELGFENVHLRHGDGNLGWLEKAPFDAILLSCSSPVIPEVLWEQLAEGGRMLLPLGPTGGCQHLVLARKEEGHRRLQTLEAVVFVPLRTP